MSCKKKNFILPPLIYIFGLLLLGTHAIDMKKARAMEKLRSILLWVLHLIIIYKTLGLLDFPDYLFIYM